MSFDKWYREVGYLGDDQNTRVKIAYEAGQQSQQAKIDELQKRIDEAMDELEYPKASWDEAIYNVIKTLKGKNSD